jgi:DNA-binding MarR family transcriptional regulator
LLQYDFQESVGYWVFSVAHELSQRMNTELAELGITFRQWEVLCWLSFFGELSQSQLAEGMLVEAPTLAGIIDRMERDGWIERIADPTDGRKKLIRPTDQVEPAWEQMVQRAHRVRDEATRGIPKEDLQVLKRTLDRIRRNLAGDEQIDAAEQRARDASKPQ